MPSTRLARRLSFQCLHKYVVPAWTDSANSSVFGTCFTPHGHGHNYELEAYVEGPMDPVTGMVMNLVDLDTILRSAVAGLDGKHVNLEVPDLGGTVPTTERLAHYLLARIRVEPPLRLVKLRLYEYENLWVDLWAN